MRSIVILVLAILVASLGYSCTVGVGDCQLDPTVVCYSGAKLKSGGPGGGGTGGTGGTGGGGTGGTACVLEDCTEGDECKERACTEQGCGFNPINEGGTCGDKEAGLVCEGGVCSGCGNKVDCGTPPECQAYECKAANGSVGKKVCVLVATPGETCNGDIGSCSAQGACGDCNDQVKNGAETGVDCGAGTPGCGKCPGDSCAAGTECKTGFCVDGVCCDLACDGECQTCGADGQCAPIAVGTNDPAFPACDRKGGCGAVEGWCACEDGLKNGTETDVDCGGACGSTCAVGQQCTTESDCTFKSGTTHHDCVDDFCCDSPCKGDCRSCNQSGREGTCVSLLGVQDTCNAEEKCNGDFKCGAIVGEMCNGPGDCATNLCKIGNPNTCASCDADNLCGIKVCVLGSCLNSFLSVGQPCLDTAQCAGNLVCVDGVCCTGTCEESCKRCNFTFTGQTSGQCAFVIGNTDPQNDCLVPSEPVCNGNGECGPAN